MLHPATEFFFHAPPGQGEMGFLACLASLHLHSPSIPAKRLSLWNEASLPLITPCWLDTAARDLTTEANCRIGNEAVSGDHIPTSSQGPLEQDPYGDFHSGKAIATKPVCSHPCDSKSH